MRKEVKSAAAVGLCCTHKAPVHCLVRFLFAEALGRWGGKTNHRLISYFLSNTSAKNYHNRIVYVKIIASQRWDVFETQCTTLFAEFNNSEKLTQALQCSALITNLTFRHILRRCTTGRPILWHSRWLPVNVSTKIFFKVYITKQKTHNMVTCCKN